MKVSIIIPTLNVEKQIQSTLDSIFSQTYTNWELIIVDGGSSDKTRNVVSEYNEDRVSLFIAPESSIYEAMNKGLEMATGDYCYFIGAGDILADAFVLKEVFGNLDHQADIIHGSVTYFNRESKKVRSIHKSKFDKTLMWKNSLHHQSAFYKKEIFNEYKFNEKRKILADYEMNLECFRDGKTASERDLIIAKCDGTGISKQFKWPLYREELSIKKGIFNGLVFYLVIVPWVLIKFVYKRT